MTLKSYYMKSGSQIRITDQDNINIKETLETKTYTVLADPNGLYLDKVDDVSVEGKIYGGVGKTVDRILNTFASRPVNTGVLLEGEKGSGKTLLAKLLSKNLLSLGVPTLVINQALYGEAFNTFIQRINQPIMILFDEFEKVYNTEEQARLLTLFDGAYNNQKLFVVTVNDTYRVIDQMKNRPGRFFYRINYEGLTEEFIREYAQDTLNDKKHIDDIVSYSSGFQKFNFDILKALIEEMNRYNEGVKDATRYLNATPFENRSHYKVVSVEWTKPQFKNYSFIPKVNYGQAMNPFTNSCTVQFINETSKKTGKSLTPVASDAFTFDSDNEWLNVDEDKRTASVVFSPRDLVAVKDGKFYYESEKGKLTLEREADHRISYEQFL